MILVLRTDKPDAEIGLYDGSTQLAYETWLAHRQLAETLHGKIKAMLDAQGADWHKLTGVVVYQGPGSFTGLRIGITVANGLALGLGVPVVGTQGDEWVRTGLQRLAAGETDYPVLPEYGAEVHITAQKK